MAWNYRRRIKIIPGVHLNFSKNGISTSIGLRGASVTIGKKSTYVNTSIPGLGIYNRQKLADNREAEEIPRQETLMISELKDNIFSLDIQKITSQDMQGIKESITSAYEQRNELKTDLNRLKKSLFLSKVSQVISYIFIFGFAAKKIAESIKTDIQAKTNAINQVVDQIDNCYVNLEIEFDSEIKTKYDKVITSFNNLSNANKIWDVTGAYHHDGKITRSSCLNFN